MRRYQAKCLVQSDALATINFVKCPNPNCNHRFEEYKVARGHTNCPACGFVISLTPVKDWATKEFQRVGTIALIILGIMTVSYFAGRVWSFITGLF
jgi:hypothetical protein